MPDASGQLQAVGLVACHGRLRALLVLPVSSRTSSSARRRRTTEDYYAADFNKRLDYVAVNLLYWFLPGRAWAGVEYLYGDREVFGGQDGNANRIQFAVRFNLP